MNITEKSFDEWNEQKKKLHFGGKELLFRERDVWWASIGINIGFEENGKMKLLSGLF